MEQLKKNWRKIAVIGGALIGILLILYLALALFFSRHFYWGTVIDGEKVGGKTVAKVEKKLEASKKDYALTLKERGDEEEVIKGETIDFAYEIGKEVELFMKTQSGFAWPWGIFQNKNFETAKKVVVDEAKLKQEMQNLKCLDGNHQKSPVNVSLVYENGTYTIKEGEAGNLIDQEALYKNLLSWIKQGKKEMDLEGTACYKGAEYAADSSKVKAAQTQLNKEVNTEITYVFDEDQEVLNKDQINKWLKVDEAFNVVLDEEAVKDYVVQLARKYDTYGDTRSFVTHTGSAVKVSGGDYGWLLDREEETKELTELIEQGESMTREPVYTQTAICRKQNGSDLGNTYVEVSLTQQHLWFYKDGNLLTDGDVVTGNAGGERATPPGTYKLDYKQRNAILRGPNYATPVSFWMPFNGGIGIHDAVWRSSFGGSIYMGNGSHGCVNAPYSLAETIFNNIEQGMPIICY